MPSLAASGANLAVVAYAQVEGTTGASTVCNSGLATTRVAAGQYVVVLPTGLTQKTPRDLIFVMPKHLDTSSLLAMAVVDDSLEATKTIYMFNGDPTAASPTGLQDMSFFILVLRTTIAPPAGAPA
jgi:hypothetical protein